MKTYKNVMRNQQKPNGTGFVLKEIVFENKNTQNTKKYTQ